MSWLELIKAEFRAILTNPAILLTVIGGILFYSFLYPQPYINQIPREQKVVLCDLDNTPTSRDFARKVNATSQVKLIANVYKKNKIKDMIQKKEALGYLLIPKNFEKDLKLQKSPTIVYGGNASYFLIYGSIAEGISNVANSFSKDVIKLRKNQFHKPSFSIDNKPLFNQTIGYINYVIPAVFILILHQIMLIGAGIQGATQTENKSGYWLHVNPSKLIIARIIVYLVIYAPIILYYLGFCLDAYSVPHIAHLQNLLFLIIPFTIAATSFGILIGEMIPRRELVTFFILASSTPLVFTAGFIWPTSLIPSWLNFLVQWIPSTPSIMAFLKLNQMGADLSQITSEWLQVVILAFLYIMISWLTMRIKKAKATK